MFGKGGKDFLEENEGILLELEKGWKAVRHGEKFEWSKSLFRFDLLRDLILTNKRIVFLKKGKVDSEIRLDQITEVYPDTVGTGNPYVRIKLKQGGASIFFGCLSWKMFLGMFYMAEKQRTLTNRWVLAINNQLGKKM